MAELQRICIIILICCKTAVLDIIFNSPFFSYWYTLSFEEQTAQAQHHTLETSSIHINNTQKRGAVQAIVKRSNTTLLNGNHMFKDNNKITRTSCEIC